MRDATIRYEYNHSLTMPFEYGLRHLKLAFCDGSQETLLNFAKERIIYRPFEASEHFSDRYKSLTLCDRVTHFIIGITQTVGYLTGVIPFIAAFADRLLTKPWYPKGGTDFQTHMVEGGSIDADDNWRVSPFSPEAFQDPFYQGASWQKKHNNI